MQDPTVVGHFPIHGIHFMYAVYRTDNIYKYNHIQISIEITVICKKESNTHIVL
jgi:hypothetical protein